VNYLVYSCKKDIADLLHCTVIMSRFQHSLECIIPAYSEYNTLQTIMKRTYIDDPLSGRQRVGRSLKFPLVGVVTVQRLLLAHVGWSNAVSCR